LAADIEKYYDACFGGANTLRKVSRSKEEDMVVDGYIKLEKLLTPKIEKAISKFLVIT